MLLIEVGSLFRRTGRSGCSGCTGCEAGTGAWWCLASLSAESVPPPFTPVVVAAAVGGLGSRYGALAYTVVPVGII